MTRNKTVKTTTEKPKYKRKKSKREASRRYKYGQRFRLRGNNYSGTKEMEEKIKSPNKELFKMLILIHILKIKLPAGEMAQWYSFFLILYINFVFKPTMFHLKMKWTIT